MNPYNIDISRVNLEGPLASLEILYEEMPATSGCEQCAEVNEERDWCCLYQTPSMYYIEFLLVFKEIGDNWDLEDKKGLLLRAIRNYLSNKLDKGCIFYQDRCTVYSQRPFECRLYGVIPGDSWEKRWVALRERQGNRFCARPQCDLVSAEKEITAKMEEKWQEHTKRCEERLGISKEVIDRHDLGGGSYRAAHDHLLLEFFGEEVLAFLTNARMTDPTDEDIDLLIAELRKQLDEQTISSKM